MQHYLKHFENAIRYTDVVSISSSTIHRLAQQLLWQKPKDRRLITEAKFHSLCKMYANFFRSEFSQNKQTLENLINTIPNDTLIIRYAYHSITNCYTD